MPCHLSLCCFVLCHVMPCHVNVISSCVTFCCVMSCYVMSRLDAAVVSLSICKGRPESACEEDNHSRGGMVLDY